MKKLGFLFAILSLIIIALPANAQKIEMIEGKPIAVKEITKGFNKGAVYFYQDEALVKYMSILRTLEVLEPNNHNMVLCKKHRRKSITFSVIGLVTFPFGYLILMAPILSNKKKEAKYLILAIEDYNKALQ
ncbi:MAG: hypothetical protein ACLFUC_09925 [Bacteroidales bacterium]